MGSGEKGSYAAALKGNGNRINTRRATPSKEKQTAQHNWPVILYKTIPPPPCDIQLNRPDKAAVRKYVFEEVFKTEDIEMKQELQKGGNGKGFCVLENLRDQMIEIQKLHAKMDEMQRFKPLLLSIRASELEWLSGKEDHDARAERNRIVHGGNVEADLEVLEFLHSFDDQERWENACVGFEELYGFPATRLQSKLDTVPKEIIGALNRRGTLKRISKWNQFPKEKDDLIKSCESIINLWLDATNSTPYLEHKITTEYNEICQKMIEVMKSKEKSKST